MPVEDPQDRQREFETLWRQQRPFLVDLAFRMLGNIGDAEDVVQDAFTGLLRTDSAAIHDHRGWLVVVVSRKCLDVLRSARVRREGRQGGTDDLLQRAALEDPDPADRVTLDDNVQIALLVVLEELSPAERAVFILHDVFRYPFDEIASIVGRSVESCRKLASRARRRVETAGGPARFSIEPAEHRRVAERFIAACAGGDVAGLLKMLDAEVAGAVDLGGGEPVPVQLGRERVARNLVRFFGGDSGVTLVSQPMNGWPGVLAFKHGRLWAIVVLGIRDGLINDIHALRNPLTLVPLGKLVQARR